MKSKTFKCGNAYLASKEIEKDKTNPLSIFMAKVDEAINKLNTIYRQEFGTDINLKL